MIVIFTQQHAARWILQPQIYGIQQASSVCNHLLGSLALARSLSLSLILCIVRCKLGTNSKAADQLNCTCRREQGPAFFNTQNCEMVN